MFSLLTIVQELLEKLASELKKLMADGLFGKRNLCVEIGSMITEFRNFQKKLIDIEKMLVKNKSMPTVLDSIRNYLLKTGNSIDFIICKV